MSGSIRIVDLPDLGAVTDASSVVAEKAGSGRLSALALRTYCAVGTLPEAPVDGSAYARLNASWQRVLPLSGGTITGNLNVSGTATVAGVATFGNNAYVQSLGISAVNSYEWTLGVNGSGDHVQTHRAGWFDLWSSATGERSWQGPGGGMVLGPVGNLTMTGAVTGTQFLVAGTSGAFGMSLGGSGRIVSFLPGFYLDFAATGPTAGTLQYVDTGGPLWVMRASDQFCFNPQSAVGGNGAYINASDRRVKANVAPSDKGLAEVLQLQPVTFTRTNPATTGNEIGFIAQDVQAVVPEAVWGNAGLPREDGEPLLGLTSETITALNVNAIKELHSMIATLQTRIASLEAAAA